MQDCWMKNVGQIVNPCAKNNNMKPSLYILIIGTPGVGKTQIASLAKRHLESFNKTVEVVNEFPVFEPKKDKDCLIVTTNTQNWKKLTDLLS